jgi:hypothetical protein
MFRQAGEIVGPGINFPEIHIAPSSLDVVVGIIEGGGTVDDIKNWQDGNILEVSEVAATPAQDIQITFANVKSFRRVGISMNYVGSATHWAEVQLWDVISESWKTLWTYESALGLNYRYSDIPVNGGTGYIDGSGNVKVRIYHPAAGNAAHDTFIDYASLII